MSTNRLVLALLTAGAMTAHAVEPLSPTNAELQKQIEGVQATLTDIKTLMKATPTTSDLQLLTTKVEALQRDVDTLLKQQSKIVPVITPETALENKIAELARKIGLLMRPTPGSESLRPSEGSVVPPLVTPGSAKVTVTNEYLEDVVVYINNKPIRVKVGEERSVSIPAGEYTYYVPVIDPVTHTRMVRENETRRLRLFTR